MTEHDLVVGPEEAGQRLDRFIASHLTDLSRSQVQRLIEQGAVLVNSVAASKTSAAVEAGAAVQVTVQSRPG